MVPDDGRLFRTNPVCAAFIEIGSQDHRYIAPWKTGAGPEKRNWQSKRLQRRNDDYAMKWIVFGLPTVAQPRNIPLIPVFRKDVDRGTVL